MGNEGAEKEGSERRERNIDSRREEGWEGGGVNHGRVRRSRRRTSSSLSSPANTLLLAAARIVSQTCDRRTHATRVNALCGECEWGSTINRCNLVTSFRAIQISILQLHELSYAYLV